MAISKHIHLRGAASWSCVWLVLSFLLVALPLEANPRKKKVAALEDVEGDLLFDEPAPALSADEARRLSYWLVEAVKEKSAKHPTACFDILRHCLHLDPHSAAALGEMALWYYSMGNDSVGCNMLEEAARREPKNSLRRETLAAAYLKQQNYYMATDCYEQLVALCPSRTDILDALVYLYRQTEQPEKAIATLDRIETIEGRQTETTLRKFGLYKDIGRTDEGFEALRLLCRDNPHDMACRLLMGDLLTEQGRTDEALPLYEEVERMDPTNANLQSSLLAYYDKTHQRERYTALRDSLLLAPGVPSKLRVKTISDVLSGAKDSVDLAFVDSAFRHILEMESSDLYLLRAYLLYQASYRKAPETDILATLWRILEVAPDDLPARRQLLTYYMSHEDLPQIERLCKEGLQEHSDELSFHYFLGASLYQQGREQEAALALEAGVRHIGEENESDEVSDLYALLGDIYHGLDREKEAFAAYDSALVYKDDNATCLNNYAYYLSLRGERLDEAEKMSYRTVRLEPLNKTYLDTYAWILYEEGDYEMARRYIDRVVSPASADSVLLADADLSAVVFEHAGDIYIKVGDEEAAQRFFRLALVKDPDNVALRKKTQHTK